LFLVWERREKRLHFQHFPCQRHLARRNHPSWGRLLRWFAYSVFFEGRSPSLISFKAAPILAVSFFVFFASVEHAGMSGGASVALEIDTLR